MSYLLIVYARRRGYLFIYLSIMGGVWCFGNRLCIFYPQVIHKIIQSYTYALLSISRMESIF